MGGIKKKQKETKIASLETGCLFEEGLILMGQGDASAFMEGVIHKGKGNMEEEE